MTEQSIIPNAQADDNSAEAIPTFEQLYTALLTVLNIIHDSAPSPFDYSIAMDLFECQLRLCHSPEQVARMLNSYLQPGGTQ